jgi:hypothetical protein
MKLRGSVAIDGPRGVVLKGGGDEFSGCLRGVDIADPRLRVPLQLRERNADALPVRLPHSVIAAHKRSQRNRFRRGKRGVPSGAVLGAGHLFAEFAFVGSRNLMPDKLLFGVRMLPFAQPREMFGADCTMQAPLLGEPALPFAVALLIAAPVVLFLRGKLPRMVCTRLTG